MFVRVAHGYDAIQLVVEVESFMRKGQPRGQVRGRQHETTRIWSNINIIVIIVTFFPIYKSANGPAERCVSIMPLTCIINSIPHLETTDGADCVFSVTFEDQLKAQEEMGGETTAWCRVKQEHESTWLQLSHLPRLDLFPQVLELLQVQLSSPIGLRKLRQNQHGQWSQIKSNKLFCFCFKLDKWNVIFTILPPFLPL